MTNLGVETRPCYKRVEAEEIPEDLLNLPPPPPRVLTTTTSSFANLGGPPQQAFLAAGPPVLEDADLAIDGGARGSTPPAPQEDQIRDSFLEVFLFSIETLNAEGVVTLTEEMPDTITSWVGSAVCTNAQDGFGLSNKTSITTVKPFFTEVSLPYSLKRGEVLNMSATVFNFLDSSLSVYLELAESEQYALADGEAAAGFDLCVGPGLTEVRHFPLTFSALGDVNITVSARAKDGNCEEANAVTPGSDTVIRPIVIKPEGFAQEETFSRFICLDKDDNQHVETVELPVRDGLVADSERAFFSVAGDLLSPTFKNLQSGLIDSPTGGGEPNMVTFVPNIYARAYLEKVGLLTERERRQTNHNMLSGVQRELRYRRADGSFSSYGAEDPEGSLWLTAFVVRAFTEAAKFIDIDPTVTEQSVSWILERQLPNGCFPRVGDLIHKELKGGTERGGEAALTAFVMLALKDVATSDQLAGGFACLEDGLLLPNKTLYSEILMAHTYLKMGQDVKGERLVAKLMDRAKREGDDVLYWEGDRSTILGGSRAVDVEMTAYMVLSLLHISGKGYLEEAARAVRWINQQRNSRGGFITTQDTIVAVHALTEFAARTFASDLTTAVEVTAGGAPVQLTADASNRLLFQQRKIPGLTLPATVKFEVSPPGCVVIQTNFKYSSTFQVPDPAFSLGVATKARGRSGASQQIEVCTSFLRDTGGADRVILEVEMPSGYIPVDSTLRSLRQQKGVRKYDSKDGKVTFTLGTVTEDKTCLEFRIIQETEVKELKPSVVKVYDFYRPKERNIIEYELTAPAVA
ncbi:alpha-2-macroglobulin-like protein 1 [Pollicipes pollicipes]|uniref:alpha-2-macroglobulin-like protein 1 n=1 Tax=Pollicipes pollicipes TaxID=41117 RepID=UPI00188581CF|nr:alpha-2-macroglobulin-like protein 1 [Pollicipes pollicipes]